MKEAGSVPGAESGPPSPPSQLDSEAQIRRPSPTPLHTGWVGITLGDPTGIGPEITLKALARLNSAGLRFLVIGDYGLLQQLNARLGLELQLAAFRSFAEPGPIYVLDTLPQPLPCSMSPGSAPAAQAAMHWLEEGARLSLEGQLDALVTAPVNKAAIIRSGTPFVGQTEFFAERAGTRDPVMMLLGEDDRGRWLRVALATTHVPIREVASRVTTSAVARAIEMAAKAVRKLGLGHARVGVCGLNPHAGEEGKMGTEDLEIIQPAVASARRLGFDAHGPIAADALFHQAYQGQYDAVVAMYHDQGLGPLKMVAFERGINWTLGLPFIRTSPDHGTAYGIAGTGQANPSSMLAALQLARQLAAAPREW